MFACLRTRSSRSGAATALLVGVLVGCAASSGDPSPATLRNERLESWQKLCESRGFVRNTRDFDDCVMGYDREARNPPIK